MDPKKVHLPEIDRIVSSSRSAVAAHREEIRLYLRLADQFAFVVGAECPEFVPIATHLASLLQGAMAQESLIADAEERLAEDLNDLSVRYDVIAQSHGDIASARAALDAARRRVADCERAAEDDAARGAPRQSKLQAELARQRELRHLAAQRLDGLYEQLIEQRERFTGFKIRRISHGYANYGKVAADAFTEEIRLLEEFARIAADARRTLADGGTDAQETNPLIDPNISFNSKDFPSVTDQMSTPTSVFSYAAIGGSDAG